MKIILMVFGLSLPIIFPILNLVYHYNASKSTQNVLFSLCEVGSEHHNNDELSFFRVNLELQNEEDREEMENLMPRIKHGLVMCILDLKKRDMIVGSSDVYRIRKDALVKINKIAHPVLVQNVLFNKFSRG